MDFNIQKKISNLIENQFPQFYQEEGPNFILFMKAYYEWMESENQSIYQSRRIFDYRDIDNTLEEFLEHFQKKYLYGIPFNVIINKRYLLKHILDVYRSKSSIQGYKLLFRLIYDEDIEIYLPGRDVLRLSHGTWHVPKYIEISSNKKFINAQGMEIIGINSGTRAIIEISTNEFFDYNILNLLYITNIKPIGGDFDIGEKIVLYGQENNTSIIETAPTVLGSLDYLEIINGGRNFSVGDIVKIAHKSNNTIISHGIEGYLRVTDLSRGFGILFFNIEDGGFGYTSNALTFVYNADGNGQNGAFNVGTLSNVVEYTYNTDLIADYLTTTLNSSAFGMPGSPTANLASNIGITLSYTNSVFGTILSLSNIFTGNGYLQEANCFARSTLLSNTTMTGTISYANNSNTVTGSGTGFTNFFVNNEVIMLQTNSTATDTAEFCVIKQVVNTTSITLYNPPVNTSASGVYKIAPTILKSNYALYEEPMYNVDGEIHGMNEYIVGYPFSGNSIAQSTALIDSGKGYLDGEQVIAYLYGAISNTIQIILPGINYVNNEVVYFIGNQGSGTQANGFITTNGNGSITSVTVNQPGSGYFIDPSAAIDTANGTGAELRPFLSEFNTTSSITGIVKKKGIGSGKGYWSTTRGFLNSDKYIQDSFYYQDFSYEIKVPQILSKYKDILYNTFHTAGTELFGKYMLKTIDNSLINVLESNNTANTTLLEYFMADTINETADSSDTADSVTI